MIDLLIVGDGPRDGAMLPRLVATILKTEITHDFSAWKEIELHRGGYRRKLQYAIRKARSAGKQGLVATVDSDKDPPRTRLRELRGGRDDDRQSAPPFPTALGEAVPHAEAWLLDDAEAIRRVLQLTVEIQVLTVRQTKDPKGALNELIDQAPCTFTTILAALAEIASEIEDARCRHSGETGFEAFVNDLRFELSAIVAADKPL